MPSDHMIRELVEDITSGVEVRQNLIELKKAMKEENNRRALLYMLGGDYSIFHGLLTSEDAKIRKNAALILGEMGDQDLIFPLYEAYQKETQLFVKSSYLTAISHLNYIELLPELKKTLQTLVELETDESNSKHVGEQIRVLNQMILMVEKPKTHKFIGYDKTSDVVLITNRNHKMVTLKQIQEGKTKEMSAGVHVRTSHLRELLSIRTYSELLFMLPGVGAIRPDASEIAKELIKHNLVDFITSRHKEDRPFYFRIELKNKMELDKKSTFAKKIAMELEKHSQRQLINSTSHYEIEIRLIEDKTGSYHVLIKCNTLEDDRFDYRKHSIAASIHPVNAALVMQLAKNYMKEDAQILDPFCGVGTMLIERNKLMPANPIYGLDIFGEAIVKGRENAKQDGTLINFINRDFFDFTHEYAFDEIVTNLAMKRGRKTEKELETFYIRFFKKAKTVLRNQGIIILYSNEKAFVRRGILTDPDYKLLKEYEINAKEGTYLFIMQVTV